MMQYNKNDKTILKAFFNFLKDNNALNEYKINTINNALRSTKLEAYFRTTENTASGYANHTSLINAVIPLKLIATRQCGNNPYSFYNNLINHAFTWLETPQGYNYWSRLNKGWCEILRMLYKNNAQ